MIVIEITGKRRVTKSSSRKLIIQEFLLPVIFTAEVSRGEADYGCSDRPQTLMPLHFPSFPCILGATRKSVSDRKWETSCVAERQRNQCNLKVFCFKSQKTHLCPSPTPTSWSKFTQKQLVQFLHCYLKDCSKVLCDEHSCVVIRNS